MPLQCHRLTGKNAYTSWVRACGPGDDRRHLPADRSWAPVRIAPTNKIMSPEIKDAVVLPPP